MYINSITRNFRGLIPVIALIWAGVSLGGNLIAAPAKFIETDLSTAVLLQVGHAQFLWLGYAEWTLLIFLILLCLFDRSKGFVLLTIPAALFVIQQLILMPALNDRTFSLIAGEVVAQSSIHLVFVVLECVKFLALSVAGIWFSTRKDQLS